MVQSKTNEVTRIVLAVNSDISDDLQPAELDGSGTPSPDPIALCACVGGGGEGGHT